MNKKSFGFFTVTLLALTLGLLPLKIVFARPPVQEEMPDPADVINAVNALRLAYGIPPLSVHPVLMQVAQLQADALAASEGAVGHMRPEGMTLGQQLIMLGYPLSGDLRLDGYRSENWVAAATVDEAISFWLGDDPHTNTMLSLNRSDIGAGVAASDQIYIVIETALQTKSGHQQSEAYDILTGIPLTQAAYFGNATQSAGNSLIPEYIIPVVRNTARPDGDVFHKVQYGQTLWSIAVTYGTTIKQLRAWNNLGEETTIYEGQLLLVQKGATQPPPPTNTPQPIPTISPTASPTYAFPTLSFPKTRVEITSVKANASQGNVSPFWIAILIVVVLVGGFGAAWLIRPPKKE